jgi:hypothetical protein
MALPFGLPASYPRSVRHSPAARADSRTVTNPIDVVLCEANVFYRGRKQATCEANLTAADRGKLLAHGVATCMILEF